MEARYWIEASAEDRPLNAIADTWAEAERIAHTFARQDISGQAIVIDAQTRRERMYSRATKIWLTIRAADIEV